MWSFLRARPFWLCLALWGACPIGGHAAWALEPLNAFLDAAERQNPDVLSARAIAFQRDAEAQVATGALLPALNVQGAYTRNQYAAKLPYGGRLLTLAPHDQLDASATVSVPILDIVAWAKRAVGRAQADMARADARQTNAQIARQVVQQYYNLAAGFGVLDAAQRSLAISRQQRERTEARVQQGAASHLEQAQAESDEALAEQNVASAAFAVAMAKRALHTLSGLCAEPQQALDEVSLHPEAPLQAWMALLDGTVPALASAQAARGASQAAYRAASWAYIPTLRASFGERLTNASALNGGHWHVYTAKVTLNFDLDRSLIAQQAVQRHRWAAAGAQLQSATRQLADRLYTDYHQLETNRSKSQAARAQVKAARLAEELATQKREAGLVTQLDVMQARRDAFNAEINRISADADVLYYRALLRLDAGIGALAKGP